MQFIQLEITRLVFRITDLFGRELNTRQEFVITSLAGKIEVVDTDRKRPDLAIGTSGYLHFTSQSGAGAQQKTQCGQVTPVRSHGGLLVRCNNGAVSHCAHNAVLVVYAVAMAQNHKYLIGAKGEKAVSNVPIGFTDSPPLRIAVHHEQMVENPLAALLALSLGSRPAFRKSDPMFFHNA